MTYPYPVDSADVRDRRELEADRTLEDLADRTEHDARCLGGWLGETTAGALIACTRCRPHLARPSWCTSCGVPDPTCAEQRAGRLGACCDACHHPTAGGPA